MNRTAMWSFLILLSKLSKGISALLLAIFIGRFFGAEFSGEYFLVLTIVLIVSQVSMMGLHQGVIKFIPQYTLRSDMHGGFKLLVMALSICAAVSIGMSLGIFLLSGALSSSVFGKPEITDTLRMMSLAIVGWAMFRVLVSYRQANNDMTGIVIYENVLLPVLLLIGVFIVYFVGKGVEMYALLTSAVYCGTMLLLMLVIFRKVSYTQGGSDSGSRVSITDLLVYSLPLMAAGLIQQMVFWSDTIMIGIKMDTVDVGVYNAGMRVALATTVILYVVNTVLTPLISKFCAEKDWAGLRQQYQMSVYYLTVAACVILLLIYYFADLVLLLFGEEFAGAETALIVLMIGQFFNIMTGSAGYILMMSGHERLEALNMAITLILNIALNLWLIPHYGIVGAAIATTSSLIVVNFMRVIQNRRLVGLPWLSRDVLLILAATALIFSILSGLEYSLMKMYVVILMVSGLSFLGFYLRKDELLRMVRQ